MGRANRPSAIQAAMKHGSALIPAVKNVPFRCKPLLGVIQEGGPSLLARFSSMTSAIGDCHEWPNVTAFGYGRIRIGAIDYCAHRVAWVIANGQEIGPNLCVCHSCDNRRCVNPEHLWLGSRRENMIDMYAKGRGYSTIARDGRVMTADQIPHYHERLSA